MRFGVVVLMVSLVACHHRDLLDGRDAILVEVDLSPTEPTLDELAEWGSDIGFGIAQDRVSALISLDDMHDGVHALDMLALMSEAFPRATFTLTLLPDEHAVRLRRGAFDSDDDALHALFVSEREYQSGLPRMRELAGEHVSRGPRVVDHRPELVAALAGDALMWSSGEILPDGTVLAFDPRLRSGVLTTTTSDQLLPDPFGAPQRSNPDVQRERLGSVDGGLLVHEWRRAGRVRQISNLVWLAPDGSARSSAQLRNVEHIAVSAQRHFVAVIAQREQRRVLYRFAIPSLAMTELVAMRPEGTPPDIAVDDRGIVMTTGGIAYDGVATIELPPPAPGPRLTYRFDDLIAANGQMITAVAHGYRRYAMESGMRVIEIDRATGAQRIVLDDNGKYGGPAPVRAGATFYRTTYADGHPVLEVLGDPARRHVLSSWPTSIARAPDDRIAIQTSDGTLSIFKAGELLAQTKLASAVGELQFRTVAH